MMRNLLKGKIHRATVTAADLHYEGSITIDRDLLAAADIVPFEEVWIYNVSNGERFQTYAITGEAGSGEICVNGAAAHRAGAGDVVIIACYAQAGPDEVSLWSPRLVYVDGRNRIAGRKAA